MSQSRHAQVVRVASGAPYDVDLRVLPIKVAFSEGGMAEGPASIGAIPFEGNSHTFTAEP